MFLIAHPALLDVYAVALLVGVVWPLVVFVTLPEAGRPTPTAFERSLHRIAVRRTNHRPLPLGCERLTLRTIEDVRTALAWSKVETVAPLVRLAPAGVAALVMLALSSLPLPGRAHYLDWAESAGLAFVILGAVGALAARAATRPRPISAHVIARLVDALSTLDEAQAPVDGYEAPGHRILRRLDELEQALIAFVDRRFTADPLTQRHLRHEVATTIGALRVHKRGVLVGRASGNLRDLLLRLLEGWSEGNYQAPPEVVAVAATEPTGADVVEAPPRRWGRLLAPGIAVGALVLAAWLCSVVGISDDLDVAVKAVGAVASLLALYGGVRSLGSGERQPGSARRGQSAGSGTGGWSGPVQATGPQQADHAPSEQT